MTVSFRAKELSLSSAVGIAVSSSHQFLSTLVSLILSTEIAGLSLIVMLKWPFERKK